MTLGRSTARLPGGWLLRVASSLFDEPALSTVVVPVLADLQEEVREARSGRAQVSARLRGYLAFWKLVAVCVVAMPVFQVRRSPMTTITPVRTGGVLLVVLSLVLFAAIWPVFGWFSVAALALGVALATGLRLWNSRHPGTRSAADPLLALTASALLAALWSMFGWFVAAAITGGFLMAFVLRRWNTRHPSTLVPSASLSPDARINMSSIPVGGDIGGFFFVVAALMIVLLGLPDVRWFVLGSAVTASVLAYGVFIWRARQAPSTFPSILGR